VTICIAATVPALAHGAPLPHEKQAIRHVVRVLVRALEQRDYRVACKQYTTAARAVFVLVEHLRRRSIHD
jgi:hypothetical protein